VTTRFSRTAAEQLGHRLFVRDGARPASNDPLSVGLQYGVGFRGLELLRRSKALQCPELAVLIYGYHDGGLATQVDDIMRVEGFGRLCGHGSIVERASDIRAVHRTVRRLLIAAAARRRHDFGAFSEECDLARETVAGASLDEEFTGGRGRTLSLRWVYTHMIEEYARHNGHADLLRQRIDGATGS